MADDDDTTKALAEVERFMNELSWRFQTSMKGTEMLKTTAEELHKLAYVLENIVHIREFNEV